MKNGHITDEEAFSGTPKKKAGQGMGARYHEHGRSESVPCKTGPPFWLFGAQLCRKCLSAGPPAAILKQVEGGSRRTEILSGVNKLFREAAHERGEMPREGKPGCVVVVEGGLPLEAPSEARAAFHRHPAMHFALPEVRSQQRNTPSGSSCDARQHDDDI
ncbi:hypothetical protein MRX96_013088 [Rhipicephalus microplus]